MAVDTESMKISMKCIITVQGHIQFYVTATDNKQ